MVAPASATAEARAVSLPLPPDTTGVELGFASTSDAIGVLAGGVSPGADLLADEYVQVRLDGRALLGARGLSAIVVGLFSQGGNPSSRAGDIQTLDNIQAPASWRLFEAWVQQFLAGDRLSLLAGLYNVNSEFDAVDAAGVFLNSSFGIEGAFGQSGANGPSIFPVTSLAFRARALLGQGWQVQAVVADGVPGDPAHPGGTHLHVGGGDGALLVAQVGYVHPVLTGLEPGTSVATLRRQRAGRTASGSAPHDLALSAGVWRYTGRSRGTGGYVTGERRLAGGRGDGPGELWAFLMLGLASDHASAVSASVVGGVSETGLLPGRPDDQAGMGLAAARRSPALPDSAGDLPYHRWEVTLEGTYRARLASWLGLGPDVQVILDPAAAPGASDALVVGLRLDASM